MRLVRTFISVAAVFAAFTTPGSRAARADLLELRVHAPSIDGAVRISRADGTWARCTHPGCIYRARRDRVVTIVAEDGASSRFVRRERACTSSGLAPACTVRASAAVDVTARFSPLRLWYPTFGRGYLVVESGRAGRACGSECRDLAWGDTIILLATPCDAMSAAGKTCEITRPKAKRVELRAITKAGRPFVRWGGRCSHAGTLDRCRFWNDYGREGVPRITAEFG